MLQLIIQIAIVLMIVSLIQSDLVEKEPDSSSKDYCFTESFHARCMTNEAVLMTAAIYGRMRIGRCVKEDEMRALGLLVGEDPRYIGCSANVLSILDRKCSGKTECEIRVYEISDENIHPCFPGLKMYLVASYSCISIVDEQRSCALIASKYPIHIIGSLTSQSICGTKSQPWIVEAPVGQRINVSLIGFTASVDDQGHGRHSCHDRGMIVERTGKKNTSICLGGEQREKRIHLSTSNVVHIFIHSPYTKESFKDGKQFILKIEAVGCSDIIPPEDTWLKRNNDAVVIGCYSSRKTWRLNCNGGKWIGVLGNCSQDFLKVDQGIESEVKSELSDSGQVLAIVAICGFTAAICLIIMCIGAICQRRFYARSRNHREYKTFNYQINSARHQQSEQQTLSGDTSEVAARNDMIGFKVQQLSAHAMYVGQSEFNERIPSDVDGNECAGARL